MHVFNAMNNAASGGESARVLVLTSSLPKTGSPGDRALRAIGPGSLFDVIELYDPAGQQRLRSYAGDAKPEQIPGFWTAADLAK
jgi:hypothetical protein